VALGGSPPGSTKADSVSLVATPSAVDFGTVSVGNAANQKISIANNGSESVQISQLSLSNAAFEVDGEGQLPVSLAAGSRLNLNVHFTPGDATDRTGQLSVMSSASATTPAAIVSLHGKGSASARTPELSGLKCDGSNVSGSGSDSCTVTTNTAAASGGLLVQLSSNIAAIKVPVSVTIPDGQTSATFTAGIMPVSSNQTGIITATQGKIVKTFSVVLTPPANAASTPGIKALACESTSFSNSGKTRCTVSVTAPASSPLSVELASSGSAVKVPGSVTIPAKSTAASFSATVAAVSAAQTITVSATENESSKTVAIHLKASKKSAPSLTMSASSLSFGDVPLGKAITKSLTLTSTGTVAATVTSRSIKGAGFSITGGSTPATLKQGQTIDFAVQFTPSKAGAFAGLLSLSTNAGTVTVSLTGVGTDAKSAPTVGAISCTRTSITGSLSDPCRITLSGVAPADGVTVSLASSSPKVTVPATLVVSGGSTAASFNANVAAVSSAQTATISAAANGLSKSIALQLKPSTAALTLSASFLAFGNVSVGTAISKSVTLTSSGTAPVIVQSESVKGTGFSVSGGSSPDTLKSGQSMVLTIHFNPTATGTFNGQLTLSTTAGTQVVSLSGAGTNSAPTISALSCSTTTITGTAADSCKVTLSGSAPKGGVTVGLASSSTKLAVPGSVTVPATSTNATFTANASAVSSKQTVKVTGTTGSISRSVSLQLNPASAQLKVDATSISFGAVVLNHATTQVVTLTSVGSSAVTVKSASVQGAGFTLSFVNLPATLNPGQTLLLTLIFDPTKTGSATGQLTIASDASTNSTVTINLTGTSTPHKVELNWNASTTGVSQYKVYRATGGTGSFKNLASTGQTTYSDTTVQSGQRYDYYVTSVGSSGGESKPSNTTTVSIP